MHIPRDGLVYNLILGLASVVALLLLSFSLFLKLPKEVEHLITYADHVLCLFFMFDFIKTFRKAPHKMKYMLRLGWLDLLSAVPTIEALRLGRLSKVVVLIRLLRIYKASQLLTKSFFSDLKNSALYVAGSFAFLTTLVCSVLILLLESSPKSNIKTAGDALWWSFVTVATVGYGDHYPVTIGGRVVAVVLMVTGITLFGVLTASLSSLLLHHRPHPEQEELDQLRAEVKRLKTDKIE